MSEKYLVGIDNGGSEIKCAVFTADGRELAVASRRLPIEVPEPGWSERDSNEVWEKNAEAVREALERAGISGDEVAGVGLTGYGNGFCLVDAKGEPSYPAIVSTDERADGICAEFAETGVERAIYPMTCQSTWAAQPIALLAWFKRNSPQVLAASRWVLGIKDWIRYKLTGQFTTEITEASSTCLCNLHTRLFDPAIFEAAGIAECLPMMPRIIASEECGGYVTAEAAAATGLAEGTPVVGGFFDIDRCSPTASWRCPSSRSSCGSFTRSPWARLSATAASPSAPTSPTGLTTSSAPSGSSPARAACSRAGAWRRGSSASSPTASSTAWALCSASCRR